MSRESKIFTSNAYQNPQTLISNYESFGWELLSINGNQITMSRETQVDCYTDLVKYQSQYEQKLEELLAIKDPAAPAPISGGVCFITFLLAIVPLALYLTYKIKKKRAYKETVAQNAAERAQLIKEMDEIALQSRGVFFSKRA